MNFKVIRYESSSFNRIVADKSYRVTLATPWLQDAICLTDSFEFTLGDCVNFKVMRYESSSFNRIVAGNSHRVTLA